MFNIQRKKVKIKSWQSFFIVILLLMPHLFNIYSLLPEKYADFSSFLHFILLFFPIFFIFIFTRNTKTEVFKLKGFRFITFLSGLLLATGLWIIIGKMAIFFSLENTVNLWDEGSSPAELTGVLIGIIILGPVYEELIFRGFLLTAIRQTFPNLTAVFICAILSMLYHYPNFSGFPVFFMIGAITTILTITTNSIFPAIFVHILLKLVAVYDVSLFGYFSYLDPKSVDTIEYFTASAFIIIGVGLLNKEFN